MKKLNRTIPDTKTLSPAAARFKLNKFTNE
jgi:hypothetical protein